MLETISVVPEMVPVKTAPPVPAGQKKPAGHAEPAGELAYRAQMAPALHALSVGAVLPVAVQKPAAQVLRHELWPAAPYLPAAHAIGAPAPVAQ